MLIILCLYVVALWVVFSKFKLVRWGWLSGIVSVLIGAFILAGSISGRNRGGSERIGSWTGDIEFLGGRQFQYNRPQRNIDDRRSAVLNYPGSDAL